MIEYDDGEPVDAAERGTFRKAPGGSGDGRGGGSGGQVPRRFAGLLARLDEPAKRRIALALAIAAGLAVGVVSTQRQRDAQALRAERDTVLLHATVDPSSMFPGPESRRIVVRLLNLGPRPIGLETVRIDAPGFQATRTHEFSDRTLAAGKTTPVSLEIGRAVCTADGEDNVSSVNPVVTAGIRTAGGLHKQISQTLLDAQLVMLYQSDCGGGYDPETFLEPPASWELVATNGRPALRGDATLHTGQAAMRVLGVDSDGLFVIRMRGGPIEVAPMTQVALPLEVTVRRCAGSLLDLTDLPSYQLRTESKAGSMQVYSQLTDRAFYALSSLYIRRCPSATP